MEHPIADRYMPSIQPIKRTFAMFHNLSLATVAVMLAFAATGVAHARPMYFHNNNVRPGYAGQVYSSAPVEQFVPGRGIVGESCDMPSSACSNDERIND
jgi:hypothetical protein